MKLPAMLLSLCLAALPLASTATASSEYPASFSLRSGMSSLLFSIDYEQAVGDNASLEVGVNSFLGAAGVSAGFKYFLSPGQKGYFLHGQGAYLFNFFSDNSGLGIGALSGGYRFKGTGPIQFDLEVGIDVFSPPSSSLTLGFLPIMGLNVGYSF
ncbi:hypothetical protein MF271_10280 [Deinococcus sp. KNUC1210]|uniref:hypothetical protein n=1 Tax=Deinococcus sp. KNUC1210 TaxID=2917691 RepID=UPI001EEFDB1B|nr:hypothetical protein [Deinococcus sp. KNUC1210]ULH14423.1 hypothetical protein MF271_10280 [Deinococcus sp. KNUC1210]